MLVPIIVAIVPTIVTVVDHILAANSGWKSNSTGQLIWNCIKSAVNTVVNTLEGK